MKKKKEIKDPKEIWKKILLNPLFLFYKSNPYIYTTIVSNH